MTAKEIPISKPSRIIKQQAEATIQSLIDAVVELITNSDDSYKRLEVKRKKHSGKIEIYVSREKGGKVKEFWIKDFAEGMAKEDLEKAIAYGEEISGFIEGKSVRGLLGRGLKEAILGLGEGEILTKKGGVLSIAKIWWDDKKRKALYEIFTKPVCDSRFQEIKKFINQTKDGTFIRIKVKNEKIKIPEYDKFKTQISNHYALRDIISSKKREVTLIFEDRRKKLKTSSKIKFAYPEGKLLVDEILRLPKYRDEVQLKIWESPNRLSSQPIRYTPWARAGILIKTKGAILDNQLFRYDNDPAAFYFFGETSCEGIAQKIKEGIKEGKESEIIDLNRKGLNWRSPYCRTIQNVIEKKLSPLIQKKKEELERGGEGMIPRSTRKMFEKLGEMLNKWAKKEFKEWEAPSIEPPTDTIDSLTIYPRYANVEPKKSRFLSVYALSKLVKTYGAKVSLISENPSVKIYLSNTKRLGLFSTIYLKTHPKNSALYYRAFKIIGREEGKSSIISCKLGPQEAMSHVKVGPQKKRPSRPPKGGFISKIELDGNPNPFQRAEYRRRSGEIIIYIKFPGVRKYLKPKLKGIETNEGSKVMLAELIGEAFCKALTREKLEKGEIPSIRGGEIEAFNTTVNDFQKKYLGKIHQVILGWRFK